MDVIEAIKSDKAYLKCKMIVKVWEKQFKQKYARTPSKFDIKEAPSKIKYAYKKYFNLKSAALDSSLSIIDFELDSEPVCSPEPLPLTSSNSWSPSGDSIMENLPSGEQLEKMLTKAKSKDLTEPLKKAPENLTPFSKNLSKKLFENKSFTLRNPRKFSLKKPDSRNTSLDLNLTSDSLCQSGNESLITESQPLLTTESPVANYTKNFTNIGKIRQISNAWLDRATGSLSPSLDRATGSLSPSNVDKMQNTLDKSKAHVDKFQNHSFGLSNITIHDKQDYIENSESENEEYSKEKIKPALKKRKLNVTPHIGNKLDAEPNTTQEVIEESSLPHSKKKTKADSATSKRASKNTKTANNLPPELSEYLPFGLDKEITPRHNNVQDVLEKIKSTKIEEKFTNYSTNTDKLEQKIKTGTLNENFVKINIEKKVFVRGRKQQSFSNYKVKQWKNKKALHSGMEFPEGGKVACFKCGQSGHMARYCAAHKGQNLMPLDDYKEDTLPTLEDMESTLTPKDPAESVDQLVETLYQSTSVPSSFMKMLEDNSKETVKPVFTNSNEDKIVLESALKMFGHDQFRPGQREAISRILSGKSTLLILSTGSGKSLCYQLPAYIYSQHYKCITLVISPLVSLMEDQVLSMPEFLKAGCLHTNQPPTQREKIVKLLKDGEISILLLSPEALISADTSNGFGGLFKSLPPIAFACIDEAHCVSQWSHNFRPSYLMLCRVLKEKLKVNCILGLTATASRTTVKSIVDLINVSDGLDGVIKNRTVPDNLKLSVSLEKDKDRALVMLLSSEVTESYQSIIVYCIRRDECERVAALLRSSLQEPGKLNMEKRSKKRKRMSYIAEPYHAGMSAAQRRKIQNHFMDGTLRIIVATVAFGMGINKSDIRAIIHYNMPASFESYVQEIGRAGRDGKPALCHVFINGNNTDKNELLKHIHSNAIDRPTIRKLLQKIFLPCKCTTNARERNRLETSLNRCKGHEVGIPIDKTVEELDIASENIATLLCYLELHKRNYIKVLNNAYTICKIISYGGPENILSAAKTCQPLAMAYVVEGKRDAEILKSSIFEFDVIEIASAIGWESGMVKYHLKNLEWISNGSSSRRSALKVEFNTLGFRIKAPGDLSAHELDKMLDDLHEITTTQEKTMLYQLEEIDIAFKKIGNNRLDKTNMNKINEKSDILKGMIGNYFDRDGLNPDIVLKSRPVDKDRVAGDVRAIVSSYKDCNFSGRSVARIFQGISSPNYPALVWGRCKFWRAHLHEDFNELLKIATQEIIQIKYR